MVARSDPPRATVRAPTSRRSSGAPLVPRRFVEPDHAGPAARPRAAMITARYRNALMSGISCRSWLGRVMWSSASERIEALLLHEDGHLAHLGSDAGSVHMEDVDAAAHGQPS